MKTVNIKFCDFWSTFIQDDNIFVDILKNRYNVVFSDSPDYVFYGPFGTDHFRYNCVRIFITGECIPPDFAICDYAVGFEHMEYEDRYLRFPYYAYKKIDINAINEKRKKNRPEKFCSYVVSNSNHCMDDRLHMIELINGYKAADGGGRYLNTVGGPVKDKISFLSNYKFNIAFENCVSSGYVTEKILDAFVAGTIPIYYGDPRAKEEFNSKAFINCNDFDSLEEALEFVKKVDQSPELYNKMQQENFYIGDCLNSDKLENYLYHIFDQEYDNAHRRAQGVFIKKKERQEAIVAKILKPFRLVNRKIRKIL